MSTYADPSVLASSPADLALLIDAAAQDPAISRWVASAGEPSLDLTAPAGLRAPAIAALARERFVLAVTASSRDGEDLVESLASLLGPNAVAIYPSWETLPHERLSPRADTVGRRLDVLRRLTHPGDHPAGPLRVVVAPVRSVLQPQAAGLGDLIPVELKAGDDADLETVVRALSALAYARVEMVERRGEFAVRGGILDVFPPTEEHPLRVEFFGDEVDEVRSFAVADQRSLAVAPQGLHAPPCRELLLTDEVRAKAASLAVEHPELAELLDSLADGRPVEGMEAFAPVLVDSMVLLVDELPPGAHVVVADPERVRIRAHDLTRTSAEFLDAAWSAASVGGVAPIDLGAAAYRPYGDVRAHAAEIGIPWWSVTPFAAALDAGLESDPDAAHLAEAAGLDDNSLLAAAKAPTAYRGDTAAALADVRRWLASGWRVLLVTQGYGPAKRLAELLGDADLGARLTASEPGEPRPQLTLDPQVATVTTGCLTAGWTSELLKLAVITETDLAGTRGVSTKDMRGKMPTRRGKGLDPMQLKPGDLVVHEQHGVGRYVEMVARTVAGATRDYLVLEYARGDKLFVPTDQLEQVTRYVGGEGLALDRIGGADWAKRKGRARKAVKEIAAELIRLYSARMASPGHAFGPDSPWQRELEDAFPYRETPDQLRVVEEVKTDMESVVPMDRLVCGDVGYGKTEIAVRAAFKAAADGKQVAVLVPTTLLVQQHFTTFSERYAAFPVKVSSMSRFNTAKEQKEVLDGLAKGEVDVVIGTHRLLSPSIKFKDLGLVIVDEEQRFGVEHKEQLKQMRTAVDVLTMSATPIPRTLEMAITGIRELSTIDTPPEERHPVLTFVGVYEDKQVAAAIRRELLRDGQVFYIHNKVESIDKAAARLRDLVPEARVATAHGQMHEDTLEKQMLAFWEREYDVLVCTTIVESGLDIANANTLIVERADNFGLSQLHQLRGRVGRGRERAYAYFLHDAQRPLTETAYDRLATIAANTDLGAGMAVAMKDLEIRGAGNLLGGEQSGHIAAVGFDLYIRLVGEAVADFRGEAPEEQTEIKVELPINANLPRDYITGERLRLEAYRRVAEVSTAEQLDEVRAELVDRYGPLPEPVENLMAVAAFRVHARRYGVGEVAVIGRNIRFGPVELRDSQELRLKRLYKGALVKAGIRQIHVPTPSTTGRMGAPPLRDRALLDWATQLLDAILGDDIAAGAAASASANRR